MKNKKQLILITILIISTISIFASTSYAYQYSAKYGCIANADNTSYTCPSTTTVKNKEITFYTPIKCFILNSSINCTSDCGKYVDYGCFAYIAFEKPFQVNTCEKKYTKEILGKTINCKGTSINPADLHLTYVNANKINYLKCSQRINESVLVIECPQYYGKKALAVLQTTDGGTFNIIDFKEKTRLIDLIIQNLIYIILLIIIIILIKINFLKNNKIKNNKILTNNKKLKLKKEKNQSNKRKSRRWRR